VAKPDAPPLEGLAAMLETAAGSMCQPPGYCDQCDNVRATAARLREIQWMTKTNVPGVGSYNAALRDVAACAEKP
jgi:hypothetical protein